ncbi:MAG: hypothetical protein KC983_08665, partial [Phycisphaerales bacterium]|nr:hypothetical protein [Phycisphaerales bacterium]
GEVFREINAAGTTHLILDLRNNGGGSGDATWALARFLIDTPVAFKPPLLRTYRFDDALRATMTTWAEDAMDMPDDAFTQRDDGWFELKPEAAGRATSIAPHPDRFTGRISVLIGPYNASGSTMLIATLAESDRVTLIGEPTGGSAEGPTAGVIFFLNLPNSGITINIPILKERSPVNTFVPGKGVQPDVKIAPTVEAYLAGDDPALEYALHRTP